MIIRPLTSQYNVDPSNVAIDNNRIRREAYPQKNSSLRTTLITFTIFPALARIWWYFVQKHINSRQVRTIIVDCCGNLNSQYFGGAAVIRFPNLSHGLKMEYFIKNIVKTPCVIFCDDDIFIISKKLEKTGYEFLKHDNHAVYSYHPLNRQINFNGKKYQLMGTYCFMARTNILKKENIPVTFEKYDTSDYLSVELQRRGYKIFFRYLDKYKKMIFYNFKSGSLARQKLGRISSRKLFYLLRHADESKLFYAFCALDMSQVISDVYKLLFNKYPNKKEGILTKKEIKSINQLLKDKPHIIQNVKKKLKYLRSRLYAILKNMHS